MVPARPSQWLCLAVALATLAVVGCGSAGARYESHLERGKRYLAEGNLDKASIEFRNASQIQPRGAEALYYNGRIAEQRRNVAEAVGLYQAAVDARPGFNEARARLGKSLVFGGAPQRALQVIAPALSAHPHDPDLLAVSAAARHQLKDEAGARADAELAVHWAPSNEDAVAVLAALYAHAGENERAVDLLEDTLRRRPRSIQLHQILSGLYLASGQVSQAEQQMRQLIALQPRELAPRILLAQHFAQSHQLDAAQSVLEKAVKDFDAAQERSQHDSARLALVDFIAAERSREQGEKLLQQFIAREPDNPALRFGLGSLLERTGATQEALETYREIVRREGTDAAGLMARDRMTAIELAEGHADRAAALIAEVLRNSPRDDDALLMRAEIALERRDPTGAVADLRAVLRDQPNSPAIQRTLARAYEAQGQVGLAEGALRAALQAAPEDPKVRIDLAALLLKTARASQAVSLLEETVQRLPAAQGVREELIQAYLAKRDFPHAQDAALELQRLKPDSVAGFYYAGLVEQQQGHLAQSQKDLEHALSLRPRALDVLTSLVRVEFARGAGEAAVNLVRDCVAHDPASSALQNLLGEVYLERADPAMAEQPLERASSLDPRAWLPHRNLARLRLARADLSGAIAEYEAALRLAPAEPMVVVELSALYEQQGRANEAIACYDTLYRGNSGSRLLAANNLAMLLVTYRTDQASLDRARDLTSAFDSSSDGSLLDTSGWVRFKRREYREAAAVLERAAERSPGSKVIRYHLGMAELQLGERDRARTDLESALQGAGSFSGSDEARTALAALEPRSG